MGGGVAVLALAGWWGWNRPRVVEAPGKTVVLVVLDTVRSQNTSLCGYERPTTPTLERLVAEGASHACRAYSPGSWTLPSHASFFTGAEVHEHGAGRAVGEIDLPWSDHSARALDDRYPTLAERFEAGGYQSVLISANPVLGEWTGLSRGFRHTVVAERWDTLRGPALLDAVGDVLDHTVDPERPLFLVVNAVEAHSPWVEVPSGLGWVEPREAVGFERLQKRFPGMTDLERYQARAQITDLYDYGVRLADAQVAGTLAALERRGWLGAGYRLVVTSDHGEYLGEHGRLAHGGSLLHETVMRVPLVLLDTDGQVELPDVLSGVAVFDLVRSGELTVPGGQARSGRLSGAVEGTADDAPCPSTGAAIWKGTDKWRCGRGQLDRYDLALDPAERMPLRPRKTDDLSELEAMVEALESRNAAPADADDGLDEGLRALGYVE